MLLSVVAFCTFVCNLSEQSFLNDERRGSEPLLQILSQFTNYNTILHFDGQTVYDLEVIIKDVPGLITIVNYDKKPIPTRPIGYNYLNVVYLTNPLKFNQFSKKPKNIQRQDVVLFISQSNNTRPQWELENMDKAKGVFELNMINQALYYKCFYCGEKGNDVQAISNILEVKNYLNEYTNFHRHTFKIGYMPYVPFFWCEVNDDCHGPEANLLHILSTTLNFEYSLTNFNDTSFECLPNNHTFRRTDGKWQKLMIAVNEGQFDWAIGGVSATPERRFLVDMTRLIHCESYRVMYRCTLSENKWGSWRQIVKPFRLNLWICLLCVLLITVLLLRYTPEYVVPPRIRSIWYSLGVVGQLTVEQPVYHFVFKNVTKRIILINWCLACIILVTVYKSKIVSMLIESQYIQFSSIKDLLEHGYTFLVSNLDWSVLKGNWEAEKKSNDMYREVLEKTKNHLSICEVVEAVTDNKVAYIEEISTLIYQVVTECKAKITPEEFSDLCLTEGKVYPSDHIWALRLGAPYGPQISKVIERLDAAGILSFWYHSVLNELLSRTKLQPTVPEVDGLNLTTMICPILIFVAGCVLSFILLLGEIAIHRLLCLRIIKCNKVFSM